MLGSQNGTFLSIFPFIIFQYSTFIHALLHPKPHKSHINSILMIIMGSLVLFSKIMYFKCFKVNLWLNIIKLTYIHYISNVGLRFVMCRNIWRKYNKKINGTSRILTWFRRSWRLIIQSIFKGGESWGYDMMYYFWNSKIYEGICEDFMRICIL